MNITENKLIAEFMEVDYIDVDTFEETEGELKYHISWDWLMPVVEKINLLDDFRHSIHITTYRTHLLDNRVNDGFDEFFVEDSTILATYKAVVEFIKWYNENKD